MDFNNMQSMDNDDARSVTSVRTDDGLGIDPGRATPDFFSDSEDDITDVSRGRPVPASAAPRQATE